jgi:hypothetical protein
MIYTKLVNLDIFFQNNICYNEKVTSTKKSNT